MRVTRARGGVEVLSWMQEVVGFCALDRCWRCFPLCRPAPLLLPRRQASRSGALLSCRPYIGVTPAACTEVEGGAGLADRAVGALPPNANRAAVFWLFATAKRERGGRDEFGLAETRVGAVEHAINVASLEQGKAMPCIGDLQVDVRDVPAGVIDHRSRLAIVQDVCPVLPPIDRARIHPVDGPGGTSVEGRAQWPMRFLSAFPRSTAANPAVETAVVRVDCRFATGSTNEEIVERVRTCSDAGMWARFMANQVAPNLRWTSKIVLERVPRKGGISAITMLEPLFFDQSGSAVPVSEPWGPLPPRPRRP